MNSSQIIEKDIADLKSYAQLAQEILKDLEPRQVILLSGPMGVGKTEWVRHLVQAMGGEETSSPTYAIHNHYETPQGAVDHLDLYRLEDEEDLESTGFWDLFAQEQGVIIIEWADRLHEDVLPLDWRRLYLEISFIDQDKASQKRRVRLCKAN